MVVGGDTVVRRAGGGWDRRRGSVVVVSLRSDNTRAIAVVVSRCSFKRIDGLKKASPSRPLGTRPAHRHRAPCSSFAGEDRSTGSHYRRQATMLRFPFIPPFCAFPIVVPVPRSKTRRQPSRTAEADAVAAALFFDDLAYRAMEEGAAYFPQPRNQTTTSRAREACKIVFRYCAYFYGIGNLVFLFVARYRYHNRELQNPVTMVALVITALVVIGIGYVTTLEDEEVDM